MSATATKERPAKSDRPLVPPEEAFWQRYSPHFELPLAGLTSFFLHALVLGLFAVGAIAMLFGFDPEQQAPPKMEVVMIKDGGGGEPEGGGGGEPGLPGDPNLPPESGPSVDLTPPSGEELPPFLQATPLDPEAMSPFEPLPVDPKLQEDFKKLSAEAEKQGAEKPKLPPSPRPPLVAKAGKKGTGNPKGVDGKGGPGPGGPGKGKGFGPGTGIGDGRKATRAEVLASRWRFDLSGSPKAHADKLAAMGVTLALYHPKAGLQIVTDLSRRPVPLKAINSAEFEAKYADAVKWNNNRPESLQGLAQELGLKFTPSLAILLLPGEREQKMAEEEARFAKQQGRDLSTIRGTWFDFRLRNGAYEPVAIRFE